jgi:Kef-type K+ transport system membrane component KefB
VDIQPTNLLVVFAAAALAPVLVDLPRRVRVPVILAEVALGIVVGPQVLDLARVDDLVGSLAELGLATLFFLAGLEIDLAELRGRAGVLAVGGWTLSLAIALAAAAGLWGAKLIGAPVLVGLALTSTSLGALVPILGDAGLAQGRLGRHAIAVGAAGELGPIIGLSVVLALASGEPWRTALLFVFAAVVVGAAHLGIRVRPPRILRLVRVTMHSSGQMAVRLSILLLAGLFVLADELGLDVILGAFSAGMVVAVVTRGTASAEYTMKLDAIGYGFLVPVFFVTTGLRFDLDGLVSDAANIVLVPGFALLFLIVRGLPVWGLYRAELPARQRAALALLSASTLPLVVAITQIAVERDRLAAEDAVALVGAGMLSLLLLPLLALALMRRGSGAAPQRSVTTDR